VSVAALCECEEDDVFEAQLFAFMAATSLCFSTPVLVRIATDT
jgi:hypothetical protein